MPQAKNLFTAFVTFCTQKINGIVNESEIQKTREARRRRNFFTVFVAICTQIMNGIVIEI